MTPDPITKIAVDARELCGHPTGVGRYLSEIVREWAELPEAQQCEFVFCAPEPVTLPALARLRADVRVAPGRSVRWEQIVLPRLAREAGADVIFAPGYSGPIWARIPLVVAIHDVSFAAHPEWFRWTEGLRRRWITRASAHKATRVLTISEFSRREIVEHLGVQRDKVTVIYPGASTSALRASAFAPGATADKLALYVGSLFNRRHIPELIEGFGRLVRRRPDARLTIVGENRTFPRIDIEGLRGRAIASDRIELTPYVSDAELDALYAHARAFVFLSDYEGFGLTPVEALARGIPIVVLDTPIAREIYGDAAIHVARPDPALIEAALEDALFNTATRTRVLQHAPAVLSRYSWRACAAQVLDVLRDAARS